MEPGRTLAHDLPRGGPQGPHGEGRASGGAPDACRRQNFGGAPVGGDIGGIGRPFWVGGGLGVGVQPLAGDLIPEAETRAFRSLRTFFIRVSAAELRHNRHLLATTGCIDHPWGALGVSPLWTGPTSFARASATVRNKNGDSSERRDFETHVSKTRCPGADLTVSPRHQATGMQKNSDAWWHVAHRYSTSVSPGKEGKNNCVFLGA